jgi:hypothetical protein
MTKGHSSTSCGRPEREREGGVQVMVAHWRSKIRERENGMCMSKSLDDRPPLFVKPMWRSKEQNQTCMLTKDECGGCFARMVA